MEVTLLILIILVLILTLSLKGSIDRKLHLLQSKIEHLVTEIKKLQTGQADVQKKGITSARESTTDIQWEQKTTSATIVEETKFSLEVSQQEVSQQKEEPLKEIEKPIEKPVPQSVPHQSSVKSPPLPPPRPPKPGFFERNPDLEKFIGENLINKIGIGILVLGIGFFVKYAIDQNWIGSYGRVLIGILCGGILIGLAHRMRKTFAAFSSVLVGGGIAILYLTITIAFHEYHIFGQAAAFTIMVVITGFTILLSLAYNRIELAVLAILGGFGSPFMVSTGEGNYIVLFVYVLLLDVGILILAYYKKWNLVNIIAYIFTILLFGSWLFSRFDSENISMITGAIIFATSFYLVFFAMNIVNNIKERTTFKEIEITMLLSNTFLYYAAGMTILNNAHGEMFRGLFTTSLGIFNFLFAFALYKNKHVDKNLIFTLIGLVLTFISLAAPIQLEGNYITLFWSAEAVLLLWLSQKSGITLMKIASVLITILTVISLLMDWNQLYFNYETSLTILLNKGYITSVVAIASFIGIAFLLKNELQTSILPVPEYKITVTIGGIIIAYVAHLLELRFHLIVYDFSSSAQEIILGSYNMAFIIILFMAEKKLQIPSPIQKSFALLGAFGILVYLIFYKEQIIEARDNYLNGSDTITGFIFHYLFVLLLLGVAWLGLRRTQTWKEFNETTNNFYAWVYVFFFVFLASAELDNAVVLLGYSSDESVTHLLAQNHKIGYPILWGLSSFLLITIGMKRKLKHLRIISLSLFFVTLLKLFIIDIRGISEGGKIAAFISLGILLLVVSFMYQRLKKIILADETTDSTAKGDPS